MMELLQCLQLNDVKGLTAQNVSNTLLFLYLISLFFTKKGFYIGAFLVIEVLGGSTLLSGFDDTMFYVAIASAFCFCYWFELINGKNIKILFAYGIMVLFQSAMVLDAYIYPDVKTNIYMAYEYVVMAIHIYIVIVLVEPRSLIKSLGDRIVSFSNFLGIGYNLSFCYTCNTIFHKVKKTCH